MMFCVSTCYPLKGGMTMEQAQFRVRTGQKRWKVECMIERSMNE